MEERAQNPAVEVSTNWCLLHARSCRPPVDLCVADRVEQRTGGSQRAPSAEVCEEAAAIDGTHRDTSLTILTRSGQERQCGPRVLCYSCTARRSLNVAFVSREHCPARPGARRARAT